MCRDEAKQTHNLELQQQQQMMPYNMSGARVQQIMPPQQPMQPQQRPTANINHYGVPAPAYPNQPQVIISKIMYFPIKPNVFYDLSIISRDIQEEWLWELIRIKVRDSPKLSHPHRVFQCVISEIQSLSHRPITIPHSMILNLENYRFIISSTRS